MRDELLFRISSRYRESDAEGLVVCSLEDCSLHQHRKNMSVGKCLPLKKRGAIASGVRMELNQINRFQFYPLLSSKNEGKKGYACKKTRRKEERSQRLPLVSSTTNGLPISKRECLGRVYHGL